MGEALDNLERDEIPVDFDPAEIPNELRALDRWILWTPMVRGEKVTKPPLRASVDDPSTWRSFDNAITAAELHNCGIGFVLSDQVCGLDFDRCLDADGQLHAAVAEAITQLDSYAERSPSGQGVHIIVEGKVERGRKLSATSSFPAREVYGSGRFFTMTGARISEATNLASGATAQAALDRVIARLFPGADRLPIVGPEVPIVGPVPPSLSDNEIVALMRTVKNGAKASRLLDGDVSDYASQSEADFALCRCIRFFTRDRAQIDRIVRKTPLLRPKWDEVHGSETYGSFTIRNALALGGHTYRDAPTPTATEEAIRRRELTSWAKFHLWWLRALQGQGAAPLAVLIAIGSYADVETGMAYPSIDRIEKHTGLSRRSIFSALSVLEQAGILSRERRHNAASVYQLRAKQVKHTSPTLSSGERENQRSAGMREAKVGAVQRRRLQQSRFHVEHDFDPLTDQYLSDQSIDTGSLARKVTKIVTPIAAAAEVGS
jgi:hypothetical protein